MLSGTSVKGRKKLDRIQERAQTALFNTNFCTYNELLSSAELPTLQNRRLSVPP